MHSWKPKGIEQQVRGRGRASSKRGATKAVVPLRTACYTVKGGEDEGQSRRSRKYGTFSNTCKEQKGQFDVSDPPGRTDRKRQPSLLTSPVKRQRKIGFQLNPQEESTGTETRTSESRKRISQPVASNPPGECRRGKEDIRCCSTK